MVPAKIIIVSDDVAGGRKLAINLEKLGYSQITLVDNIQSGTQLVGILSPDLVLLDVNHQERVHELKDSNRIREQFGIPVIFIIAFAEAAVLYRTRPEVTFSLLIKPYESHELESIIRGVLLRYDDEKKLRQSEEKYRSLFNIMAQGVVYQSETGEIIAANPAAERILGLPLVDLLGKTGLDICWKTIHEDGSDFAGHELPFAQVIKDGVEVNNVIMGIYHSGKKEHIWIRVHSRRQNDKDLKSQTVIVSTFEDITEIKQYQDGLTRSEIRYRSLVETLPEGINMMDLQGRFLTVNHHALEMQGFESLEKLQESGLTCFDFVKEPSWLKDPQQLQSSLENKSPQSVEYTFQSKDGFEIPVQANLALLKDADNQPNAFLMINQDITDLKKNIAQLRKLSQAVMQSGDIIFITDNDGLIETVNPQFERTTGYSLSEVIGKTPRFLKSGEHPTEYYVDMWQTLAAGKTWRGELRNKRKDGTLYWEEVSFAPVFNDTGKITNYIAINKDINERKQMEQMLRIKDYAISSSINAIGMTDLDGKITYVNPAFLRILGFSSMDEVDQRNMMHLWQDPEKIYEIFTILKGGNAWNGELVAQKNDGTTMVVDVSAHPVLDDQGKPLCIMGSFVDISARKQAEAAEREEHRFAEAMRKTAEALISTLNVEDVLDLIMENAGLVVENDAMSLVLLDEEKLRITRFHSKPEFRNAEILENVEFQLDEFPILKEILETMQPRIVEDVNNNSPLKMIGSLGWVKSYIGLPMHNREKVIGFLLMFSAVPGFFTTVQTRRMQAFATQAAVAIDNATLYERDHMLSITDGLTGLSNSRYFYDLAKLEFERSRRYGTDLSLMMMDIDYFKNINDTYGHLVGDFVLREVAKRIRSCLRVYDLAARYGGEEFAIIMAQTDQEQVHQIAHRIHRAISTNPFEIPDGHQVYVTVSLGVVNLQTSHKDLKQLVTCADEALYNAKNAGRNQVSFWK